MVPSRLWSPFRTVTETLLAKSKFSDGLKTISFAVFPCASVPGMTE